jgi:ArsR family transcriptional regulator
VQETDDTVGTTQRNLSPHLATLPENRVLKTRRDATRVFYRIGDVREPQLIGMMREVFCGHLVR